MKLKTRSGKSLNPIGIGTWGIGGAWEADYDNDQLGIEAIRYSVSIGQNHIDCAEIYGAGHTEEVVGRALNGRKRHDLFLTDKLWETHVAKGKVKTAFETMLKKLNTDYLDVLYIHKPWEDFPWREAIYQINNLIDEKRVRYFGVSNFNVDQLKETMAISRYAPVINQLHHNILYQEEVTKEMKDFCQKQNIQIIAWKPLERGEVLKSPVTRKIAKSRGVTTVQVALAWLLDQNIWPIPMAISKKNIDDNLKAVDLKLTVNEISQLDQATAHPKT